MAPGGHQSTDFSEFQISQEYKKQIVFQKGMPIGEGLGFLASLVILWQTVKVIQKRTRKILPLVIFVLFVGNLSARDVVWKYSFYGKTIQNSSISHLDIINCDCCNKTLSFTNTYNNISRIKYTNINGIGLKMKNTSSITCAMGDIIEQSSYSKIKKITIRFDNFSKKATYNSISVRDFNQRIYTQGDNEVSTDKRFLYSDSATHKITLKSDDSIWTVNINAPQNGILIHFTIQDSIVLKSIEIEYEDNSTESISNYKFLEANGNIAYAFADTSTQVNAISSAMIVPSLQATDWSFSGWSPIELYDDSLCITSTSVGGSSSSDSIFHAIYNHRRPKENPVDPDSASRYYSLYSDVCPVMDENGYEVSNDVTFPDGVRYKMSIDNTRFYYFSLPYDCPYSYIKFSNESIDEYVSGVNEDNTAYIGEWLITRWDESGFEWHDMSLEELQQNGLVAGVGYGIGIVPDVNTDVYFHSDYYQKVCPLHNDTIPISFTYPVKDDNTGYHSGWNFLGSRFFQAIDYAATNTNYVLEPDSASTGWILHSKYKEPAADKFTIAPFSAYMVQTNMDMVYNLNNLQAVAAVCSENHFNLAIRQEGDANRMDYSTIVANPNYTDKYEIGMDMGKMLVQDYLPQIYSVMDSSYYAINASGFGIGSKIKVGIYVPHKENWVVSLGKNIEIPEGWHIILKDKSTGEKKDLTVEEYQFNLKKGLYPNRFEVEISDMPLDVEDVSIKGDCEPTWMRIVSISGIVAYEGEFDLDRLDGLTEGIYVVQTDVWVKKMLVR